MELGPATQPQPLLDHAVNTRLCRCAGYELFEGRQDGVIKVAVDMEG